MGHTYLNTAAEKLPTPLPVDAYHIDTPVEQYDLVRWNQGACRGQMASEAAAPH